MKIGYTAQTLSEWGKRAEFDNIRCPDIPIAMFEKMKALEGCSRELRQQDITRANEHLGCALTIFLQERLLRTINYFETRLPEVVED